MPVLDDAELEHEFETRNNRHHKAMVVPNYMGSYTRGCFALEKRLRILF